jgi:hypothetical protein
LLMFFSFYSYFVRFREGALKCGSMQRRDSQQVL